METILRQHSLFVLAHQGRNRHHLVCAESSLAIPHIRSQRDNFEGQRATIPLYYFLEFSEPIVD